MRNRDVVAALALLLAAAPAHAQEHLPAYTLNVRLDPESGGIEVAGRLDHACVGDSTPLYLNQTFQFEELRDSAGPIAAHFDTAGLPMPYADITRRLVMERRACAISFRYDGRVADTLANVNIISPALVELASYAGWYFESPDFKRVNFDVTVTLPARYLLTGNGRVVSADTSRGYQTVRFKDAAPGFDIALVAAVGLRRTSRALGGLAVTMYSPVADSAADDSTLADLLSALRGYKSWYGPAGASGELRVVYSPRGGWGYSRIPFIISSARYRNRQLARALGRMRVMQGAAHELAHFWWSIADVGTTDDWINEGLAEHSAFAAVAAEFGEAARDSLLAGYRRDATRSEATTTIAASSAEGYVNRYEKPVLLLADIEQTYGPGRVRDALRELYGRFRGTRAATTAAVLSIFGRILGLEAEARLKACIVDVVWQDRCPA
jgi:hypothetical protein